MIVVFASFLPSSWARPCRLVSMGEVLEDELGDEVLVLDLRDGLHGAELLLQLITLHVGRTETKIVFQRNENLKEGEVLRNEAYSSGKGGNGRKVG